MRIQVRKCPFTGEIFEETDIMKYAEHLKIIRNKMKSERQNRKIMNKFDKWISDEKLNLTHPDMIPEWFLKNQRHIMDLCTAESVCIPDREFFEDDMFSKFSWPRVRFEDNLSNSHTCPHNGVTNWCAREKYLPSGYPGWHGYLKGTLVRGKSNNMNYPYSYALNRVGIKTGSGGGGNENFSYDFKLFLADWPGLEVEYQNIMQDRIVNKLKGQV